MWYKEQYRIPTSSSWARLPALLVALDLPPLAMQTGPGAITLLIFNKSTNHVSSLTVVTAFLFQPVLVVGKDSRKRQLEQEVHGHGKLAWQKQDGEEGVGEAEGEPSRGFTSIYRCFVSCSQK